MIDRAHALGLKVYGGTLNPVEGYPFPGFWTADLEAKRQAVNQWIRTSNAYDAVIDFDRLRLHRPEAVHDLPAGGKRLVQRVEGYRYTVKSGEVTFDDGVHTGALPGSLVRGGRDARVLA